VRGADQPRGDNADIERLATLSLIDYDRCRQTEAKRLGIRVTSLDAEVAKLRHDEPSDDLLPPEPEPFEEPVDGVQTLAAVMGMIRRYVVLSDAQSIAIALWVVHAHAHDAATISPRLAIGSPTKRCGKTTLMSVVQGLVPRALSTSNITTAAVFRVIEIAKPCLLIDEADTFLDGNDDLRGILNGGHNRSLARVIRTAGEKLEPKVFKIWAPVAIAMIGRLPATLADRSVEIDLKRKRKGDACERFRADRIEHLVALRRKIARWVSDHIEALRSAEPEVPTGLDDRAADNWRPLFAIADQAGGPWSRLARAAAVALAKGDTDDAAGIMLLEDIRSIRMTEENGTSGIFTKDLLERLHTNEQRPWAEWSKGKPINAHQLSKLLAPFGILSPRTIRIGPKTSKGYQFDWFADAFSRYLPPSVTPSQAAGPLSSGKASNVTSRSDVTEQKRSKRTDSLACDGVTALSPGSPPKRLNGSTCV
jgi:putative DNA primase/helicase